ncbi:hypothetical protein V6N13_137352 [Hibiscus sabdariffa]
MSAMEDSSSSSGESVRVSEEEWSDREDVRGTVNISGSCDDGMKVPSDEEAAADIAAREDEHWIVPAVREDQLVDVVVNCVGSTAEGSNTEMLVTNGHKRKVRLLTDIISSLQLPEEKRKANKTDKRRERGRPRKSVTTFEIADISLSDSDLLH